METYFEDTATRELINRATDYARAGVCVHFKGTAGVGKTSLALRVAQELGRPTALMTGNEWLTAQDFIGQEVGATTSKIVDRYVQSVRRSETKTRKDWCNSILAQAMESGQTLIYDEFTRATPEANATLLSVLEEGVLVTTDQANPKTYLHAHPDFRIIMTSNPHDYLGVNSAPDALMDRIVTMPIEEPGLDTLTGIVAFKTALELGLCRRIVAMVLEVRKASGTRQMSTLRSALLIARIATVKAKNNSLNDYALTNIATDVLVGRGVATTQEQIAAALGKRQAA